MTREYRIAVCPDCEGADMDPGCDFCDRGGPLLAVTAIDSRDVLPLVDAVRDTLCDDELCARCDHLQTALRPFTDQDNNQGGKQC